MICHIVEYRSEGFVKLLYVNNTYMHILNVCARVRCGDNCKIVLPVVSPFTWALYRGHMVVCLGASSLDTGDPSGLV